MFNRKQKSRNCTMLGRSPFVNQPLRARLGKPIHRHKAARFPAVFRSTIVATNARKSSTVGGAADEAWRAIMPRTASAIHRSMPFGGSWLFPLNIFSVTRKFPHSLQIPASG
jgi:hypothetical protein